MSVLRLGIVGLLLAATPTGSLKSAEATNADHPIAICLGREPNTAVVAQQRGGGLLLVDYEQGTVLRSLGQFGVIADIDRLTPDHVLVAADDPPRLVILPMSASDATPRTIDWPIEPTAVRVSAAGHHLAVLGRDDRRVDCLPTSALTATRMDKTQLRTITLPFQPGRCLWLPDETHLVVADAYGGRLAVIDALAGRLTSARVLPGHNIAGLAVSSDGQRLFLTHQILHGGASTSLEDIHWGGTLTNVLRSLAVKDLLDPTADHLAHNVTMHLGETGRATGDPNGVAVREDGTLVVALSGVNELAVDRGTGLEWKRIAVGARPTAVTLSHDGRQALVANTLDNTLSAVRLDDIGVTGRTFSLGEARIPTAADRGERLFFDARLSHDGWMSCQSCHPGGHTNGQLVDNFSDGTEQTPKRVLSLRGIRDTAPYAWDGRFATLADQVRHSVTSTMQGEPLAEDQVADLVAFLQTLPASDRRSQDAEPSLIAAGKAVFERYECSRCHAGEVYTSSATYDVGLTDERGAKRFNPPSLRGLRTADGFLHDARATQLEDVFRVHQHQLSAPLEEADRRALLAFLQSL